jgi:hypothetical protein
MRIKSRLKYYPNPDRVTNWGQVFILAVGKKIGDVAKLNNILSRAK